MKMGFKTYAGFLLLTLGALFIIRELDLAYPISVTTTQRSSELAVTGEGKIDISPDTALIRVGIVVSNMKTVQEAQNEVSKRSNQIIDELSKLGVDKKDMKTTNYNIYPQYGDGTGREVNSIKGYNGSTTVQIKTKKIDQVGTFLAKATEAGANQVEGVEFAIDDPAIYRKQARDAAIASAKEQAKQLSQSLGIKLGKITNIVESSYGVPGPMPYMAAESLSKDIALGGAAPAIQPGTQTISTMVTVYFEKK